MGNKMGNNALSVIINFLLIIIVVVIFILSVKATEIYHIYRGEDDVGSEAIEIRYTDSKIIDHKRCDFFQSHEGLRRYISCMNK